MILDAGFEMTELITSCSMDIGSLGRVEEFIPRGSVMMIGSYDGVLVSQPDGVVCMQRAYVSYIFIREAHGF